MTNVHDLFQPEYELDFPEELIFRPGSSNHESSNY